MEPERRSGWLLWLLAATLVLTIGGGAVYVNRQVAASELRDCETLLADITALGMYPPTTPAGVRVLEARRHRYHEIRCETPLPAPARTP